MSYTTTDRIASIKSIASIPTSQNLFATADFLRFLNYAVHSEIVPLMMTCREEYFVADFDHSITASKSSYAIPTRAIGGKLRDVQVISSNGDITSLARLEPAFLTSTSNNAAGFYLKGNNVIITPTPTTTQDTLRLSHFRRPNTLVATSACAQITSIDTATNQVTVATLPTGWTTGTIVDMIQSTPGFDCHSIDVAITGVAGTTITFASLPATLVVGDWLALAGSSPIPQVPVELLPLLDQIVVVKCLLAQGKNAKAERETLAEMKQSILTLLTPRVDGETKKITGPNLLSYFRRS